MELRAGDGLLLHQQAGADFDFAANAKWIDALVADGLRGVRPYDLPVIILRALIDRLYRLPVRGQTQQIEPAVAVQVCGVKNQCRPGRLIQQREFSLRIAEPDQRAGRALPGAGETGDKIQIERSVVIEIGRHAAALRPQDSWLHPALWRFRRSPSSALRSYPKCEDGAVSLYRQQIENAVVIGVGGCDRFDHRQIAGKRALAELSLALIHEDMKPARAVNDRRVGIAVAIEISPGKAAQPGDSSEGMDPRNVPSPLFLRTVGTPLLAPSTISRSPSASMSTAHAPV